MARQKERSEDRYGEAETAQRRDDVIRRMIATPPKLHSEMKRGKGKKQATNPKTRPASKGRVHKGKTRA